MCAEKCIINVSILIALLSCDIIADEDQFGQCRVVKSLRAIQSLPFLKNENALNKSRPNVSLDIDDCSSKNLSSVPPTLATGTIMAGQSAFQGLLPWQVRIYGNGLVCGGALISNFWVITAGHCITFSATVQLGFTGHANDTGSQSINSAITLKHPSYTKLKNSFIHNDIGMIKLERKTTFSKIIRPICLPDRELEYVNYECYISGFGQTEPDGKASRTLQWRKVSVLFHKTCRKILQTLGIKSTGREVCLRPEGKQIVNACIGDSGGPLSCKVNNRFVLAGILSTIVGTCKYKQAGDILMRTSTYLNWIQETMEEYD